MLLLAYLLARKNCVIFVQDSATWSFFFGLPLFFFSLMTYVLYNITIVNCNMEKEKKERDMHIIVEGALQEKIGVK